MADAPSNNSPPGSSPGPNPGAKPIQQFVKPGGKEDAGVGELKGIRAELVEMFKLMKRDYDDDGKTSQTRNKYKKQLLENVMGLRKSFDLFFGYTQNAALDQEFRVPKEHATPAATPAEKHEIVKDKKASGLFGSLAGFGKLGQEIGGGIGGLIGGIMKGFAEGLMMLANPQVILGIAVALGAFFLFTQIIKAAGKPFLDFLMTFADIFVKIMPPVIEVIKVLALTLEHLFTTLVDGLVKNPMIGPALLAVGVGLLAVAAASSILGQPQAMLGLAALIGATFLFGKVVEKVGEPLLKFLDGFANIALRFMPAIIEILKNLGEVIGKTIIGVIRELGVIVVAVLPIVTKLLVDFGRIIGDILIAVIKAIGPALPVIINAFKEFYIVVVTAFKELAKVVLPLLPAIIGAFRELFTVIGPIIRDVIGIVIPAIKEIYLAVIHFYETVFKTLIPAIVTLVQTLVPAIVTLVKILVGGIVSLVKIILGTVKAIIGGIVTIITSGMSLLKSVIGGLVEIFKTFKEIIESLGRIGVEVLDKIKPIITEVGSIVLRIIQQIQQPMETFMGLISKLIDFVPNTLKAMSGFAMQMNDFIRLVGLKEINFPGIIALASAFAQLGAGIASVSKGFGDVEKVAPGFIRALNAAIGNSGITLNGGIAGVNAAGGSNNLAGLNVTNSLIAESNLYLKIIAEKTTEGRGQDFKSVLNTTIQNMSSEQRTMLSAPVQANAR